jgi:hypothetical protein
MIRVGYAEVFEEGCGEPRSSSAPGLKDPVLRQIPVRRLGSEWAPTYAEARNGQFHQSAEGSAPFLTTSEPSPSARLGAGPPKLLQLRE